MSDKAPQDDDGRKGARASSDAELEARRSALAAGIASRRQRSGPFGDGGSQQSKSGYGLAVKVSSEFIAGVAVGAILGFGFDGFFETSPWGLIVFLMLGFAAGVLNVLRAVGKVAKPPKL